MVVLRHDPAPLLVFHRHDGHIGLPGGKIEPGETPAVAGARETLEETRFSVTKLVPVHVGHTVRSGRLTRVHAFLATEWQAPPPPWDMDAREGRAAWGIWDDVCRLASPFGAYNRRVRDNVEELRANVADATWRAFCGMPDR